MRVLAIKSKKIAITIANTKLAVKKLLMALTKVALIKDKWDMSIKKI